MSGRTAGQLLLWMLGVGLMVSQTAVLKAIRSAGHPVTVQEITDIIGPQCRMDRSSVVGEVATRCNALKKKGKIERCGINAWAVV